MAGIHFGKDPLPLNYILLTYSLLLELFLLDNFKFAYW